MEWGRGIRLSSNVQRETEVLFLKSVLCFVICNGNTLHHNDDVIKDIVHIMIGKATV